MFSLFEFTLYSEFSVHFKFKLISCQSNSNLIIEEIMSNFSLSLQRGKLAN